MCMASCTLRGIEETFADFQGVLGSRVPCLDVVDVTLRLGRRAMGRTNRSYQAPYSSE